MALTLEQLNSAPRAEAAQMLDGLYEHSPWIAEQALNERPFQSLAHLKHAMCEVLAHAGRDAQLGLGLFVGGFGRQRFADHGLARQLGVGADQAQLRVAPGVRQHLTHGVLEVGQRLERAFVEGLLGDPGRMLVQAIEHLRLSLIHI